MSIKRNLKRVVYALLDFEMRVYFAKGLCLILIHADVQCSNSTMKKRSKTTCMWEAQLERFKVIATH